MPKSVETIDLDFLNSILENQVGSKSPTRLVRETLWECPVCANVQSAEDFDFLEVSFSGVEIFEFLEVSFSEVMAVAATLCSKCNYSASVEPQKAELKVKRPNGQETAIFRPYNREEAQAYKKRKE